MPLLGTHENFNKDAFEILRHFLLLVIPFQMGNQMSISRDLPLGCILNNCDRLIPKLLERKGSFSSVIYCGFNIS